MVRTGIEELSYAAMLLLFISGMILGGLKPRKAWRWGVSTMALFPVFTIIDIAFSLSSHNLLPFELLYYLFLMIPGVLGAKAGAFLVYGDQAKQTE